MKLSIFAHACLLSVYLLWWNTCSNLLPIVFYSVVRFLIDFWELFICSGNLSSIRHVICKYFLQCILTFHSLNGIFNWAKFFNWWNIIYQLFFFTDRVFEVVFKIYCLTEVTKTSYIFFSEFHSLNFDISECDSFELFLVYSLRYKSRSFFSYMDAQLF